MDDFVAHTSRWRTARDVGPALAFVGGGLWMVGAFGPVQASRRMGPLMTEFVGWLCILFFGMCVVLCAKQWWKNEERLRISRSGVRITEWSDQTIPWDEISDVTEWRDNNAEFIVLHLRDPSRFRLTGSELSVSLYGTNREFDEAMVAIATFRTDR